MVLVIGAAVAVVLLKPLWYGGFRSMPSWARLIGYFLAGQVALTPTLLTLRLIRPRPTVRQLCRQPGFVACGVATILLGLSVLTMGPIALFRAINGRRFIPGTPNQVADSFWWVNVIGHFALEIGPAVIAAWTLLALSGRRRPGRDWLDHAGRAVGAAWIVVFVANAVGRLYYLIQR